jgi:hypothetical protein
MLVRYSTSVVHSNGPTHFLNTDVHTEHNLSTISKCEYSLTRRRDGMTVLILVQAKFSATPNGGIYCSNNTLYAPYSLQHYLPT